MGEHLTGRLVDPMSTLPGRAYDKQPINVPYDDTELRGLIADNAEGIEANAAAIAAEVEARVKLEEKHDFDHKATGEALALANRKIRALTDVLAGKELAFDTQDYDAATVDVPTGAVADTLLKIGGASIYVNQLVKPISSRQTVTANGITIVADIDGSITINGTATVGFWLSSVANFPQIPLAPTQANRKYLYWLRGDSYCGIGQIGNNNHAVTTGDKNYAVATNALAYATPLFQIFIKKDRTFNNCKYYPQCIDVTNYAEVPSIEYFEKLYPDYPYSYNPGEIVSTNLEALVVRGKNLFTTSDWKVGYGTDVKPAGYNGFDITEQNGEIQFNASNINAEFLASGIKVKPGDEFVISAKFKSDHTGDPYWYSIIYNKYEKPDGTKGHYAGTLIATSVEAGWRSINYKVSINYDGIFYAGIYCNANNTYFKEFQIERGTTPTPYKPYHVDTIPLNLPELRSAVAVYDYHDFVGGKSHKRVGIEHIDGSEDWNTWGLRDTGLIGFYYYKTIDAANTTPNMFSENFEYGSAWGGNNEGITYYNTATPYISICGKASVIGSNVAEFKTWLNNHHQNVHYELAEEVVEDIDPIPELEAITVEAGGEVRFVDSEAAVNLPIPSTHEWIVRNAEV